MKTTLNIPVDTDVLATVAASLKGCELGRLFKALAAAACAGDAEQYLNNSGLRLAFALLSPPVVEARQRTDTLRANGAKGGRPRKNTEPADTQDATQFPTPGSTLVSVKKTKKETPSPTPPIKEKIKKNNIITLSQNACEDEVENGSAVTAAPLAPLEVLEWDELQERMLQEQPWLEQLCMTRRITQADMATYIMDFIAYLRERDLHESLTHAKVHFVNQLPYIIKQFKTNNNHETHSKTHQGFIADPVARREFEREARRQEVRRAIAELATQGQQPVVDPFDP
jgi:hypothetical protein